MTYLDNDDALVRPMLSIVSRLQIFSSALSRNRRYFYEHDHGEFLDNCEHCAFHLSLRVGQNYRQNGV